MQRLCLITETLFWLFWSQSSPDPSQRMEIEQSWNSLHALSVPSQDTLSVCQICPQARLAVTSAQLWVAISAGHELFPCEFCQSGNDFSSKGGRLCAAISREPPASSITLSAQTLWCLQQFLLWPAASPKATVAPGQAGLALGAGWKAG